MTLLQDIARKYLRAVVGVLHFGPAIAAPALILGAYAGPALVIIFAKLFGDADAFDTLGILQIIFIAVSLVSAPGFFIGFFLMIDAFTHTFGPIVGADHGTDPEKHHKKHYRTEAKVRAVLKNLERV